MPVEEFEADVKNWRETAKNPRWKRLYTDLTYPPMLDVLQCLRDNGFKTYIVTSGGQDFARVYSQRGPAKTSEAQRRGRWFCARLEILNRMAALLYKSGSALALPAPQQRPCSAPGTNSGNSGKSIIVGCPKQG
ncbi:haloacid dehalogenase-like hydrolase [Bradyrhizobium sp. Tv2a-2]|uniref:haloacid dehalogenase-like hydrolase n=1 Tax=Bradyrhizobium sp. Tv2a-2 TaxID=113395 RepID=UPI00042225C8|nr:haloacid dehalogenase-like hydrolase [Bradyrhizobium sp. Tv2a-2]